MSRLKLHTASQAGQNNGKEPAWTIAADLSVGNIGSRFPLSTPLRTF